MTRLVAGTLVGLLLSGCTSTPKYERRYQPPGTLSDLDRKACEEYAAAEVAAMKAKSFWGDDPEMRQRSIAQFLGITIATFGLPLLLVPPVVVAHARETSQRRANRYGVAMDDCLAPVVLAQTRGPDHPGVAGNLRYLADRHGELGRLSQAEALYRRAIAIQEKAAESERSALATTLAHYAALLRRTGREQEARDLEARAIAAQRASDRKARETALEIYQRGYIEAFSGNYATAEPLYQEALAIQERTLHLGHEDVVRTLESYAELLRRTDRGFLADQYETRARSIRQQHEPASPAPTGAPTE